MKTIFLVLLVLVGLVFFACDNDSPDPAYITSSKLAIIDIANATNLFIASGSNSRSINGRAVGDTDKLFKITDDGYIQEVSYYDMEGNQTTVNYSPTAIYDVNDTYIIVCFGNDGYLVRKTDGAVFSLDNVGVPSSAGQFANFNNAKIIQNDPMGNIYYVVSSKGGYATDIIKIDTSNPNNLTKVIWAEGRGFIYTFNVSPATHTIYGDSEAGGRIKKINGGLINIVYPNPQWIGLDDNIKYFDHVQHKIWTVNFDTNLQEIMSSIDCSLSLSSADCFLLRFNDRILSIGGKSIYEIENPSNTPRQIAISEISTVKNVVYSNNYYYLSGNNASNQPVLLKVDPKTDTVKMLLSPNLYDIFKMTVDNNDVVSFNAERMSDGVKVVGQVSSTGVVSILNETLNTEIVILERIR
jgi:hypothetical protein